MRKIISIISLLLILLSAYLYSLKSIIWFNFAVFGFWFLFDSLAHWRGKKTTLDLLFNKPKKFAYLYLTLLVLAVLIELIGSLTLHLWSYPKLWAIKPVSLMLFINLLGYLCYPFILISFR